MVQDSKHLTVVGSLRNGKCGNDGTLEHSLLAGWKPSLRQHKGGQVDFTMTDESNVEIYYPTHSQLFFDSAFASNDLMPFHKYRPLAMSTNIQKLEESFEQICKTWTKTWGN